jgi:hypothetical protein
MNFKSTTKRVSGFVTAVMRSWPPHHRCHTDNEQQQPSNGIQQIVAGDKLFLTDSTVSPQQPDSLEFIEVYSRLTFSSLGRYEDTPQVIALHLEHISESLNAISQTLDRSTPACGKHHHANG